MVVCKKNATFAPAFGKMPEWSIGPHSKCGVRVTVPGVRIPLFPQMIKERGLQISLFFLYSANKLHPIIYMRILFICLGNICRSPLAETILNAKLAAAGLHAEVDSAGLIAYHAGEQADPRMRAHAARRGYNITHRARQITQTDFFRFDLIIGMDADNQRALQQLAPAQTAHKIRTAVSYCDKFRHADAVPDPYYGGDAGFEYAIDLLEDACDGIIATLQH